MESNSIQSNLQDFVNNLNQKSEVKELLNNQIKIVRNYQEMVINDPVDSDNLKLLQDAIYPLNVLYRLVYNVED